MFYCVNSDFPFVVTNYCESCDCTSKYRKNSNGVASIFGLYICNWRMRSNENALLDLNILYSLYSMLQFSQLRA